MKKKRFIFLIGVITIFAVSLGIVLRQFSTEKKSSILIGSTTSLQDSGLLDELLPIFYEETGIEAKVIAVGTGQAIKLGQDGEVDLLLVHDKLSEITFVEEGHGTKRWDVMYNEFILVGPAEDPLGLKEKGVLEAFTQMAAEEALFVSRGDQSGTHKKELSIWKELGMEPTYSNYVSAGKGMGDVLKMADELRGYTLSDMATYLKLSKDLELDIMVENDEYLMNMYGVIAINPNKNTKINSKGAQSFIKWLLSPEIQKKIEEYGVETYGRSLFIPCDESY
ncbi:substrate-binding domain-containing protein [Cellulosilyticum sp. I15G10I2]|uniref:substrate-binding domain-containing protein n=1 Tax=Cellulosilyticum sp. I15G10I2 TaxID=1892843 RepID=UPI00085C396A|nr:substrate-binding domain-containing protein [Cellulosilyticum sp. I15G10I2]